MPEKTAAVLTINNAPDMDLAGRKMVAKELRHQLDMFVKHGDIYGRRFQYHYRYIEGDYAPKRGK